MASTYSPLLRIQLMATGDQAGTWGDTTNVNLGTLIEQAIAGTATFSVTSGDVTLTDIDGASDQARCMALRVTGSPSPGTTPNIIAPYDSGSTTTPPNQPASKFYIIANGATSSVVIKTAIPAISNGSFVVGCQYTIASLGSTSNAEWNTIAGTSGVTYSNGSVFTATITGTGTGNGTATPAGVTVPSGEVYLVYFDTTFNNFRLVGRSATSANTPNTLVLRDSSGNFAAGDITVGDVTASGDITATTVTATNLNGQVNGNLAAGITTATPATGDNTPKVANTAFVQNSIASLVGPLSGGSSGLKTVSGDYNTVTISSATVTLSTTVVTTQVTYFGNGATTVTLKQANSNIKVGQRLTGTNISPQTFVNSIGTATVTAGSFVVGVFYTIVSLGTTDWNVVADTTGQTYEIGDVVEAKAVGSGTGTAYSYTIGISQATIGSGTGTTLTFSNMPAANTQIVFKTTGTLPTGLSPNTIYYVVSPDPDAYTFSVSLTSGGSAITTSGSQSGTHSFTKLATTGSLEVAGTLGAGFGGTGTNSLKANNLIVGNNTSAVQVIPAGAANNVLTSVTTSTVTAGSFVVGTEYTILTLGSGTDWNAVAGTTGQTYTVGQVITAAAAGSGTGTATTNVWQSANSKRLTSATFQNTTATTVTFSDIPSWVKRITVMLQSVTGGPDDSYIRLGTSSGIATTGYNGAHSDVTDTPNRSSSTTGIYMGNLTAGLRGGVATIVNVSENNWAYIFQGGEYGGSGANNTQLDSGSVLLPGTLTQLQLVFNTAPSGGTANIMYD